MTVKVRSEAYGFADTDAEAQRVTMVDSAGVIVEATPGAASIFFVKIDTAASGGTDLVAAAGAGNRIRVLSYVVVAGGTVNVKFTSGTGPTDVTGPMPLVVNGGVSANSDRFGLFATAANAKLSINLSAAVQVSGHLTYILTA